MSMFHNVQVCMYVSHFCFKVKTKSSIRFSSSTRLSHSPTVGGCVCFQVGGMQDLAAFSRCQSIDFFQTMARIVKACNRNLEVGFLPLQIEYFKANLITLERCILVNVLPKSDSHFARQGAGSLWEETLKGYTLLRGHVPLSEQYSSIVRLRQYLSGAGRVCRKLNNCKALKVQLKKVIMICQGL